MKDSSQRPEQNDWQEFKPLFGGGKIKLCDTLRAVTPFGGLSVLIEFFGPIGLVDQLQERSPYQPQSPNHYEPGPDPGQLQVERYCRSPVFRACRSTTG